jgi:hypothetical protein
MTMVDTIKSFGIQPKRTSFQSSWQNGAAERFVGNCRRDLLGHVIVVNEGHLKRLMKAYISYYHEDRTHLGLGKETPPDARPKRIQRPIGESFRSRDWEVCIIDTTSPRSRCYFAQQTLPSGSMRVMGIPTRRERRRAVAIIIDRKTKDDFGAYPHLGVTLG